MNSVKTAALMTLLACIMMAIGSVFGGRQGMYLMLLIAIGMNFFSYWFSDSVVLKICLLYTSPSPRDLSTSRMPSSA